MIRPLGPAEQDAILTIINEAAQVYRGVIPEELWHEPYMTLHDLQAELRMGVRFFGYEAQGRLVAVMGRQEVKGVTLIRHAYVLPAWQRQGLGGKLLRHLLLGVTQPVLVGTWAKAHWAVRFYEKHGFIQEPPAERDRLLRTYWSIPDRQIDASVVLSYSRESGSQRFPASRSFSCASL
jgi:GNAT superfamily N-acetyltransferase|uniref:N-acetyltransferase n=1 Tax=Desulfobacca acetoxidans TaxID=60893 RepID=A0A7C5ALC1_9BACT